MLLYHQPIRSAIHMNARRWSDVMFQSDSRIYCLCIRRVCDIIYVRYSCCFMDIVFNVNYRMILKSTLFNNYWIKCIVRRQRL